MVKLKYALPYFKFTVFLWFVTFCYVIFGFYIHDIVKGNGDNLDYITRGNKPYKNQKCEARHWAVSSYSFLSVLLRLVM